MATANPYAKELTDEEQRLGFVIRETVNPRARFVSHPEKVEAVLYEINKHDRIIKMHTHIQGSATYKLQRYGRWRGEPDDKAPGWKALSDVPYATPETVLKAIADGMEHLLKQHKGMAQPQVVPCEPGDDY
jgi:hypothetical protein